MSQGRGQSHDSPHQERYERSHEAILAAASRLIRERGIDGASVNDVMGAAGLTRGGFYAHFPDKEHLVAETVGRMFYDAYEKLILQFPETGEAWAARASKFYLSLGHLRARDQGCVIPTLGGEIARQSPLVRDAFTKGRRALLDNIAYKLGGDDAAQRALFFLSACIGAFTIARAEPDEEEAGAILDTARDALLHALSPARAARTTGRRSA